MRISEDRYSRDLRRINLARRLLYHEVRTRWISTWTGLSGGRIRNLFHSYVGTQKEARRHRGPSPRRIAAFLRSPALRSEASAIGGLACALELIPRVRLRNARKTLPSLELGERVCYTFELYRHLAPGARFTLDQFFLLVMTLAGSEDLAIGHCTHCHGALLFDQLSTNRRLCPTCKQASARPQISRSVQADRGDPSGEQDTEPIEDAERQQPLF
jgi:hypothetical protein